MIHIAYTISPTIQENLAAIDDLRRKILITPLSTVSEHKLVWQKQVEQITGSLRLANTAVAKGDLMHLLVHRKKRVNPGLSQGLAYKQALDWIDMHWRANPKLITPDTIEILASVSIAANPNRLHQAFRSAEADLKQLLNYLQSANDHPILLAGVAQAQLSLSPLSSLAHGMCARLVATLLLAKFGYDCRGMIAMENGWMRAPEHYVREITSIYKYGQLTMWLEYYTKSAKSVFEELAHVVEEAGKGVTVDLPASYWRLNPRQEELLGLLAGPATKVTNREIQHRFRISQITASRDLTRLVALGMLYSHGKGRSVYYTKA